MRNRTNERITNWLTHIPFRVCTAPNNHIPITSLCGWAHFGVMGVCGRSSSIQTMLCVLLSKGTFFCVLHRRHFGLNHFVLNRVEVFGLWGESCRSTNSSYFSKRCLSFWYVLEGMGGIVWVVCQQGVNYFSGQTKVKRSWIFCKRQHGGCLMASIFYPKSFFFFFNQNFPTSTMFDEGWIQSKKNVFIESPVHRLALTFLIHFIFSYNCIYKVLSFLF